MSLRPSKELTDEWNKKLKESGFKDIEGPENTLVYYSSYPLLKWGAVRYVARESYFQLAGQFLHDFRFKSELDRLIWECHSDGQTVREIAAKLKDRYNLKVGRDKVNLTVRRLSKVMLEKCSLKPT